MLALNITEKRLLTQIPASNELLVNDAQNDILKMSKLEVLEYTDTLLEQHKWLHDLVSHYLNAVNL